MITNPTYVIMSSPAIDTLVSDLVTMRCAGDIVPNRQARHCSAIFLEKNGSYFKNPIIRDQSRQLCDEESGKSVRIRG